MASNETWSCKHVQPLNPMGTQNQRDRVTFRFCSRVVLHFSALAILGQPGHWLHPSGVCHRAWGFNTSLFYNKPLTSFLYKPLVEPVDLHWLRGYKNKSSYVPIIIYIRNWYHICCSKWQMWSYIETWNTTTMLFKNILVWTIAPNTQTFILQPQWLQCPL